MLLIYPPVVKPSEPPGGLAALSGALSAHGVPHRLVDANLEGLLWLLDHTHNEADGEAGHGRPAPALLSEKAPNRCASTWTKRALRHLPANLAALREWQGYASTDRYRKAVLEVNRIVESSTRRPEHLSLADYGHDRLTPVSGADLLYAADHPEENVFYPYFKMRLPEVLEDEEENGVIGVSLNFLSQALCAFSIIGFIRKERPRAQTVLGGSLITSWMSSPAWRNPFGGLVDELIPGPGELPLLALAGIPVDGDSKKGHGWQPRFDGLPLDRYLAPGPILPYSASTGCYWRRCSFCPETAEGHTYIPKPPGEAIADLQRLAAFHRPALFHMADNAVSPALMAALAASPLNAPWYGFARITDDLADPEFCRRLRASGCVMLKLGLESGDQRVLDKLGKSIELTTASQALKALKNAGIATYIYLLFGTPAENLVSARKTLDFVAARNAFIDFLNCAVFNLPVNCEEAGSLDVRPFYKGDLSLYSDFLHPEGWGRKEVRMFLDGEFKRHPAVRPILLRQPPLFTSNHAPLLRMAQSPSSTRRS